jgi:hypothetical protein
LGTGIMMAAARTPNVGFVEDRIVRSAIAGSPTPR